MISGMSGDVRDLTSIARHDRLYLCEQAQGGRAMSKTIEVVFEGGVFKPLEKVDIKEHERIRITVANETERLPRGECTLAGVIDLAKDCSDTDLSAHHDKYLYGGAAD